jgi:hypothetical protein
MTSFEGKYDTGIEVVQFVRDTPEVQRTPTPN